MIVNCLDRNLQNSDSVASHFRSDYVRAHAFNHLIKQKGRTALKPLNSFPQSFFVKQVVNNKKNGIAKENSKTDKKTTHFLPEVSNLAAISSSEEARYISLKLSLVLSWESLLLFIQKS